SLGCTFKISLPFVHTSNVHPTPQNVHTVFVFFVRVSRIFASASDTAIMPLYPGSTSFTRSIIGFSISGFKPVIKPALPSIDYSIKTLQGKTETHCPQRTQEDSLINTTSSHMTRGRSAYQSIDSVSFTCKLRHTSTQRPQAIHWFGSYR